MVTLKPDVLSVASAVFSDSVVQPRAPAESLNPALISPPEVVIWVGDCCIGCSLTDGSGLRHADSADGLRPPSSASFLEPAAHLLEVVAELLRDDVGIRSVGQDGVEMALQLRELDQSLV